MGQSLSVAEVLSSGTNWSFADFQTTFFRYRDVHKSIGAIEEFAAEYLLSHHAPSPQALVAATIAHYPQAEALHAAFALVSLAAHLEDPIVDLDPESRHIAREIYRCVSAFTADICAVSHMTASQPTCADIAAFWSASKDTFFRGAAMR